MLGTGSVRGLLGEAAEPLRERVLAVVAEPRPPDEIAERLQGGWPVSVSFADDLPIGDLGHPYTDGRMLLAILAADRRGAELLRRHGLDEAAVRAALPVEPG